MANEFGIGEAVASSMQTIIESKGHRRIFKRAEDKCCQCSEKCGADCACKKDGKCAADCDCCETVKNAANKCCSCDKCGKDCPCKGKCPDCADCMPADDSNHVHDEQCAHDQMKGAAAVDEIIAMLSKISAVQDELGLTKSAAGTLKALSTMVFELSSVAQDMGDMNLDENDVKVEDIMRGGFHSKEGPYEDLLAEIDEIDPIQEQKAIDAPRTYRALLQNPDIGRASISYMNDPEYLAELQSRIQDMGGQSSFETAVTELAPPSFIGSEGFESDLPPESMLALEPLPGGKATPDTEKALMFRNESKGRFYGRDGEDSPEDFAVSPENNPDKIWITYDAKKKSDDKTAFQRLDAWLSKQAQVNVEEEDFEDESDDLILDGLLDEFGAPEDDMLELDFDEGEYFSDMPEFKDDSGITYRTDKSSDRDLIRLPGGDAVYRDDLDLQQSFEQDEAGLYELLDVDPDDFSLEEIEQIHDGNNYDDVEADYYNRSADYFDE